MGYLTPPYRPKKKNTRLIPLGSLRPQAERPPQEVIRGLRRRLWVERLFFSAALAAVGTLSVYPYAFPRAWAVYVDGRPVVAMRDRTALQGVLEALRQEGAGTAGPADFLQEVRVERARPVRLEIADAQGAARSLRAALRLTARRAVLYVDGERAVALPDLAQAEEALSRIKRYYAHRLDRVDAPPVFKEKVEVRVEEAEQELWADVDTALALLRGEEGAADSTHIVAPGESAARIARRYRIKTGRLAALNPAVDLSRLQPGQTLNLGTGVEPLVTVVTEGLTSTVEEIPFQSVPVPSDAMFKGDWTLGQEGKPGKRRVRFHVRCENGVAREARQVSQVEVEAPRPKIEVYGTRRRPRGDS